MNHANHTVHRQPTVIANDYGGHVSDYNKNFNYYQENDVPVVLRGTCSSACARFMKLRRVCATPTAYFNFHGLRRTSDNTLLVEEGIEDSRQTDTPEAFALEQQYDTFHMSYTDTRPYAARQMAPGISIVYIPVIHGGRTVFQEFLRVKATNLVKACH